LLKSNANAGLPRWSSPVAAYTALVVILLSSWYIFTAIGQYPDFILPGPALVWQRFQTALMKGRLLFHFLVTLWEVAAGLCLGTFFALITGYLLSKSRRLENFLSPVLVASQAVPIVAVAPLLIIWFGPGLFSKILVCSIIIYFPVLVNVVAGLKSVPNDLQNLMTSLNANRKQKLVWLEIPATLPYFFTGMKVGATLSVTGAVVGEFLGADKGLGFLINVARGQYDTALVMAIIIILVLFALALYYLVVLIEKIMVRWKE
jgi:NitT/TauT family transport system permease protein